MSETMTLEHQTASQDLLSDWIAERRREARMVIADMAHHSDYLVRLAADKHADRCQPKRRPAAAGIPSVSWPSPRHAAAHQASEVFSQHFLQR